MNTLHLFGRPAALAALSIGALLAGCQKTSTTSDTPSSTTTTTTTVAPTAGASAAMTRTGEVLADSAITAKVKSAFLVDSDVKGLRIDVDTKDGVVTLNGSADKAGNIERATSIAKGIDGVKSVDNKLMVK